MFVACPEGTIGNQEFPGYRKTSPRTGSEKDAAPGGHGNLIPIIHQLGLEMLHSQWLQGPKQSIFKLPCHTAEEPQNVCRMGWRSFWHYFQSSHRGPSSRTFGTGYGLGSKWCQRPCGCLLRKHSHDETGPGHQYKSWQAYLFWFVCQWDESRSGNWQTDWWITAHSYVRLPKSQSHCIKWVLFPLMGV